MANSLLHDCRGGSFTSPPCGEDLCYTCGPGEEALRRQHEDDEAARDLMEERRELLTHSHIPWARFEALGGSIEQVEREARLHGDKVLAARAARALRRRSH